ncbi:12244_t:CDS:1, partial [Ambispora leptoticha]
TDVPAAITNLKKLKDQTPEKKKEESFKEVLNSDSTVKNVIETLINNAPDLEPEEKTEAKTELVPIILVANTLKNDADQEKQKIGNLMKKYNEFAYKSNENLKDMNKTEELQAQLKDLEKYVKDSGEKHTEFTKLKPAEQEAVIKLVSRIEARISMMIRVQTVETTPLPDISYLVIFGIITLIMVLGGAIFYFVQGVYGKESEIK